MADGLLKTFRIAPDPAGPWYFTVHIFRSRVLLNRYLGIVKPDAVDALTMSDPKVGGSLGTLFFHQNCLSADTLSHEAMHAVLAWHCALHSTHQLNLRPDKVRRMGSLWVNAQEEQVATALGGLVYQLGKHTKSFPVN